MSNKLLIDKKQRNLLLFSNFLKNTEKDIFHILKENLNISIKIAKENDIENRINNNLPTWLNFSRKEWKAHDKNPFLISDSDSIQNCELCNSPLKWRYEMYNEISNKKISIGGECVKQFKQLVGLGKLVTNEEEYKRYNWLIKEYPLTLDVLVKNTDILERTEIILPDFYQVSFKKIQKELTKQLRDFIKRNKKIDQNILEKSLIKYSTEINSIKEFIEKNQGNRNYLSRNVVEAIEKSEHSHLSIIVSTVEGNGGIIPVQLSPKIKVSNYLKLYEKDINIKFSKSKVSILDIIYATYILQIKNSKNTYNFKVNSEYLLNKYHERISFEFPNNFKKDIDEFIINDIQTKDRLYMDGQKFLLMESSSKLKDINFRKIISFYDNDLTKDEYDVVYQKVTSILSRLLVISKVNSTIVEIFTNKDVESTGKSVLFGVEPCGQDISIKMNENDFYRYIANQIV